MTDRARALLDNLLGKDRDCVVSSSVNIEKDSCIFLLAGCCPFLVLKNTKLYIGKCKYKNHEIGNSRVEKHEPELLRLLIEIFCFLDKSIKDQEIDKNIKIEIAESNIELKLNELRESKMRRRLRESYEKFREIETDVNNLEKIKESFYVGDKRLKLPKCNICGINIIVNYGSSKYQKHLEGKLHNGVLLLKARMSELLIKYKIYNVKDIFKDGVEFKYIKWLNVNNGTNQL